MVYGDSLAVVLAGPDACWEKCGCDPLTTPMPSESFWAEILHGPEHDSMDAFDEPEEVVAAPVVVRSMPGVKVFLFMMAVSGLSYASYRMARCYLARRGTTLAAALARGQNELAGFVPALDLVKPHVG